MSSSVSWFSAPTNRQPAMPSAPTSRALDELDPLDQLRENERRAQGLTEQLGVASAARWSHRVRVSVIPLTLGIALGLAGVLLFLGSEPLSTPELSDVINVAVCLMFICCPVTLLSAPANDARAAVGGAVFYMCVMILIQVGNLSTTIPYIIAALDATPVCGMRYQLEVRLHVYLLVAVTNLGALAVLLSRLAQHSASRCAPLGWLRPITTRQLTQSTWRTMGITYLLVWCLWVFYLCAYGNIMPAFDTTALFADVLSQQFLLLLCTIFCLR
jgi:hypothetical protein